MHRCDVSANPLQAARLVELRALLIVPTNKTGDSPLT